MMRSKKGKKAKKCKSKSNRSKSDQRNAPSRSAAPSGAQITLKDWDPDTPYLKVLKKESGLDATYQKYIKIRKAFEYSPSFYFDCADFFFKFATDEAASLAVRILSTVLELEISNAQLARTVGYKLTELGRIEEASGVFEKVLKLRPDQPQSYRDLALLLIRRTPEHVARGLQLLDQVHVGSWRSDFQEIEHTTLMELAWACTSFPEIVEKTPLKTPERMRQMFPVDLRISMAWDTDNTDVDLHVIEPNDEECMYSNRDTWIGGHLSRDFTRGLGPEEYVLKHARKGKYIIKAKYFANHKQSLTGGTTLLITIIKFYGKPGEERKHISVRMAASKQLVEVGTIEFT